MSEINPYRTFYLEETTKEYNLLYTSNGEFVSENGELFETSYFISPIPNTLTGSYYDSEVTWINNMIFSNIPNLTSIDLPNLLGMGNKVFQNNPNLTSVSIPKVQWLNPGTFTNCSSLSIINLSGLNIDSTLGGTPLNQEPLEGVADNGDIYVPSYFSTLNSGSPAEGLQYLSNKGWTIHYV
jgi:hypothetical protein